MNKYYAVKFGRKTGVFTTWEEVKEYTNKFPASLPSKPNFKAFLSEQDATNFLDSENIKKNKELLLKKLSEFGFEGFFHVTEFKNMLSILNSNFLYSRVKAAELGFEDKANKEIIEKTRDIVLECVRFYYKSKTPTYKSAGYIEPIMLIFNKNLIFNNGILFSYGNAKSNDYKKTPDPSDALGFNWETIFKRGTYSNDEVIAIKEKLLRNAEFLVINQVSLDFLLKIIVRDNNSKEKLIEIDSKLKDITRVWEINKLAKVVYARKT